MLCRQQIRLQVGGEARPAGEVRSRRRLSETDRWPQPRPFQGRDKGLWVLHSVLLFFTLHLELNTFSSPKI